MGHWDLDVCFYSVVVLHSEGLVAVTRRLPLRAARHQPLPYPLASELRVQIYPDMANQNIQPFIST
jgi:hypothetical protein